MFGVRFEGEGEPCWVQGNSSGGIVPEFLGQNIFPSGFRLVHNDCGCCFCRIISFTSRLDLEFKPLSGLPFRLLPLWPMIRCQSMFVFLLKCQSREYCKVFEDSQIFFPWNHVKKLNILYCMLYVFWSRNSSMHRLHVILNLLRCSLIMSFELIWSFSCIRLMLCHMDCYYGKLFGRNFTMFCKILLKLSFSGHFHKC